MKKYSSLFVFTFACLFIQAQQLTPSVICNSSGVLTNANTNVYWTIGETVIGTMQSGNNQLTNGFTQSNYIITAVKNNSTQYKINLFPNPTTNFLNLETSIPILKNARYQLFDANGKMILDGTINNEITTIDCTQLLHAMYLLRISDGSNDIIQSFKIVKQ